MFFDILHSRAAVLFRNAAVTAALSSLGLLTVLGIIETIIYEWI